MQLLLVRPEIHQQSVCDLLAARLGFDDGGWIVKNGGRENHHLLSGRARVSVDWKHTVVNGNVLQAAKMF